MASKKEMSIMACLRQNAKMPLIEISKATGIPISTVHDKIKQNESSMIKKYTAILDFAGLGYNIRAKILIKSKDRQKARKFLMENKNANSVFEVNNGFDFIADCIFQKMDEFEDFNENLEKFSEKKQVHFITGELKREEFFIEVGKWQQLTAR